MELLQINLDVTNRAFREADNEAVDISFDQGVLAYIFGQAGGREPSVQELRAYLHKSRIFIRFTSSSSGIGR